MINLFQIAPNDQSILYLKNIFHSVGDLFSTDQGDTVQGLLSILFKTFNSILLTVGVLIVFYITIIGVIATAHEGEALGRRWHSLWVPIRAIVSIAALVPTPSGYSSIQIIMMWIIIQGIGAADTLWSTALGYIEKTGSPYASISIPGSGTVTQTLQHLFQGLTCQASAKANYSNPSGMDGGGYYCNANKGEAFCGNSLPSFNPSQSSYTMGPGGICGTLKYCNQATACAEDQTSLNCIACTAQLNALKDIIPVLTGLANKLVDTDYQYRQFYYTSYYTQAFVLPWITHYCSVKDISSVSACCIPLVVPSPLNVCKGSRGDFFDVNADNNALQNPSHDTVTQMYWPFVLNDTKNFIQTSAKHYSDLLNQAISDAITHLSQDPSKWKERTAEAQKYGWIFAGAYYHYLAKMNNDNVQSTEQPFTINISDPSSSPSNRLYHYRNNYQAAESLIEAAQSENNSDQQGKKSSKFPTVQIESSSFSGKEGKLATQLSSAMGDSSKWIMQTFMKLLTGDNGDSGKMITNPLIALQSAGEGILSTISDLYITILGTAIAIAAVGFISPFALGTGLIDPVGPIAQLISIFVTPVLYAFMTTFLVFGGLLAVYLPLVPYIIFIIGVVGWLASTIEAMIAAPLVALGVLAPGGNHEIFGKAEPALMLTFAIFLRPGLMIFGLIAALLLSGEAVTLINASFLTVMGDISPSFGLFKLILFMAAYTFLVITILNKCFALIHIIPERVMRWISGQGDQYGEAEALGEVKGGVQSAGSQAAAAAGASKQTSQKSGDFLKQRQEKQQKEGEEEKIHVDSPKDKDE